MRLLENNKKKIKLHKTDGALVDIIRKVDDGICWIMFGTSIGGMMCVWTKHGLWLWLPVKGWIISRFCNYITILHNSHLWILWMYVTLLKMFLQRMFCQTMRQTYCGQWLTVTYNDAQRLLLKKPRWTCDTELFGCSHTLDVHIHMSSE